MSIVMMSAVSILASKYNTSLMTPNRRQHRINCDKYINKDVKKKEIDSFCISMAGITEGTTKTKSLDIKDGY